MEGKGPITYEKINSFTEKDWQPLFELIPALESKDSFGHVVSSPGTFPYYVPGEEIDNFFREVHKMGIIIPFDWTNWETGKKIMLEKDLDFNSIDIPDKCRVFTMLIRLDRFSEGTLGQAFESGMILKILKSIRYQVSTADN
jgi:hypothetical protein